jgi:hypothetical protein
MPRKSKSSPKSKSLKSLSPVPGSPVGVPLATQSSNQSGTILFSIVIWIIALIINVYALVWIMKLEAIPECKCSDNWMRLYIKYFLHVYIPILIISIILYVYLYLSGLAPKDLNNNGVFVAYRMFVGIVGLFGFANMIIAIVFINKLKEINCECSEDIKREIYFIYNIVLASFMAIIILLGLMAVPIAILSMRK